MAAHAEVFGRDSFGYLLEAIEDLFRHEGDKERGFLRWQRKLAQSIW